MSGHKVKITVIKRTIDEELIRDYISDRYGGMQKCDRFSEGDVFYVDHLFDPPEGFCPWAWADIRRDIMLVGTGGGMPVIRQPHTLISGCTDWFRPVIFKLEQVESGGE
ncbi:MAG TPA: TIGR04076 family protein [Candidatus Krumholzibacterium sp.]|nr:TIGR04076 family protein [Candidatus Krumholzibacterium sp.]